MKVSRGPTASSVNLDVPPTEPTMTMGVPEVPVVTKQLDAPEWCAALFWSDSSLMLASVDAVVKFHIPLFVWVLEKHHTSSLTGWLYDRRTCLVPPSAVTVSPG